MTDFLHALMQQRRKFLDGLNANEGDINLDIFEDFYPDQAHFVFELLQNAEDTGATEASFTLTKKGCWFEHNGARAFSEDDVRAITGINDSTKKNSVDQIGKFGVGFKSVFVYTQTPTIYSASFSFRITQYVMPEPVAGDPAIGTRTKFWLPFNNPKKDPGTAYADIAGGLDELAESTLLFLPNIESIKWCIGEAVSGEILRIEHTDAHVEVLKQVNGQTTTSAHYLRFSQAVRGLEKQRVAIAFALDTLPNVKGLSAAKPLAAQAKIVPTQGQVSVFFPAKKEASGLRFHLHAPFVPELSRASIKDTAANAPLFSQLAELSVSALYSIRDLGLLTPEFLGVLPNPLDQLGKPYDPIRDSIVAAMDAEPLTPTHGKSHSPARALYQAKVWLKDLLSTEDIEFLIEYEDEAPLWAANRASQVTNTERFMSSLAITDWDAPALVECIAEKGSDSAWQNPDPAFLTWLAGKSVEWHQQLYAQLARDPDTADDLFSLRDCKIVRLSDGEYATGPESFFAGEQDVGAKGVNCVDAAVYNSGRGKAQQDGARKFLEEVGVTTLGELQLIEALLRSSYSDMKRPLKQGPYLADLRRFMKLAEEDDAAVSLLSSFPLLMGTDNQWHEPAEIFLDTPFVETGLGDFFKLSGKSSALVPLSPLYQSLPIDTPKLARFAERLGCITKLGVTRTNCRKNPQWSHLANAPGERFTSPVDRDYLIEGLTRVEGHHSVKLARLIWVTMCGLSGTQHSWDYARSQNPLRATYQKSESRGAHYADSQLVHQLRTLPWVPQEGGEFVKPAEARAEFLPHGFIFDAGWPWIKAIQFGTHVLLESVKAQTEAAAVVERQRKQQEAAKALGFEDAETARRLAEIPVDQQKLFYAEWERRKNVILPEHKPANPGSRSQRVFSQALNSPERKTEERTRSVSVGREEIKAEADQYLQQQYTNEDAEQICQICKDVLPFKLDDGSYFFEAVELLPEIERRHRQNYLCLCPNHSAMFRHANNSRDTLKELISLISSNEVTVLLAKKEHSIYFTETHLNDLRAILAADEVLHHDHEGAIVAGT